MEIGGNSMKKKSGVYNPEVELAKGATLDARSYDKTPNINIKTSDAPYYRSLLEILR